MKQLTERERTAKRLPTYRIRDFDEVELGFTEDQAIREASRDIRFCKASCMLGCPVGVNIPGMLRLVAEGKYEEAYRQLIKKSPFPAITGRVCPQERQCEMFCVLAKAGKPISIGAIERFVGDWALANNVKEEATIKPNGLKVAVVGSGPASIVVASDLARLGYSIDMFEESHMAGGVLVYGIPEFRLPKEIVRKEVQRLKDLGVNIRLGVPVGTAITVGELAMEYDAVFLGVGAGHPKFLNVPGENLLNVYTANEFLTRANLMKGYKFPEYDTPLHVGKRVAVIGAGNTAMDSVRTAKRLGAEEAIVVYRRSREEMPARAEEVLNAEEEGIKFEFLLEPIELLSNDKRVVSGIKLMKMKIIESSNGERRAVVPTGDTTQLDVDTVITAVGFNPNPSLKIGTNGLDTDDMGRIKVDGQGRTSLKGVYAGGDIVTGEGTVIEAMGWGRRASTAINEDLSVR